MASAGLCVRLDAIGHGWSSEATLDPLGTFEGGEEHARPQCTPTRRNGKNKPRYRGDASETSALRRTKPEHSSSSSMRRWRRRSQGKMNREVGGQRTGHRRRKRGERPTEWESESKLGLAAGRKQNQPRRICAGTQSGRGRNGGRTGEAGSQRREPTRDDLAQVARLLVRVGQPKTQLAEDALRTCPRRPAGDRGLSSRHASEVLHAKRAHKHDRCQIASRARVHDAGSLVVQCTCVPPAKRRGGRRHLDICLHATCRTR